MKKNKKKKFKVGDTIHHGGVPYTVIDTVNDVADSVFKNIGSITSSHVPEGDVISEDHKQNVLNEFKENWFFNQEFLDEATILPPASMKIVKHMLKPDIAAYAIGGSAMGLATDIVSKLLTNAWQWFKDYQAGQDTDIKAVKDFAERVRKHVDKRTKIMIGDLKQALEREEWIKAARIQKELKAYGKKAGYMLEEEGMGAASAAGAPTNNVGDGHIAGAKGDPPGRPKGKILRRKKFAGINVFEVSSDYFYLARMGKRKYARYEQYVGDDETGRAIREFGNANYGAPIIIQDELTGAMCYLRYGNKIIGE